MPVTWRRPRFRASSCSWAPSLLGILPGHALAAGPRNAGQPAYAALRRGPV